MQPGTPAPQDSPAVAPHLHATTTFAGRSVATIDEHAAAQIAELPADDGAAAFPRLADRLIAAPREPTLWAKHLLAETFTLVRSAVLYDYGELKMGLAANPGCSEDLLTESFKADYPWLKRFNPNGFQTEKILTLMLCNALVDAIGRAPPLARGEPTLADFRAIAESGPETGGIAMRRRGDGQRYLALEKISGGFNAYNKEATENREILWAFLRTLGGKAEAWLATAQMEYNLITGIRALCCYDVLNISGPIEGLKNNINIWYRVLVELATANDVTNLEWRTKCMTAFGNLEKLDAKARGAGFLYLIETLNARSPGLDLALESSPEQILEALRLHRARGGHVPATLENPGDSSPDMATSLATLELNQTSPPCTPCIGGGFKSATSGP